MEQLRECSAAACAGKRARRTSQWAFVRMIKLASSAFLSTFIIDVQQRGGIGCLTVSLQRQVYF